MEGWNGMFWLPVGGLVIGIVMLLLGGVTAGALKLNKWETGSFVINTMQPNTAFLGFPVMLAFFGEPGLQAAILYTVAGNFLAPTVVNWVSTYYGHKGTLSVQHIMKEIIAFPLTGALILGIGFNITGIRIPERLDR